MNKQCVMCGLEVEKPRPDGEWVHSGFCMHLYHSNMFFEKGKMKLDESSSKKVEGIYRKFVEKK